MEPFTSEVRLGDVIDDYCIKCRRLTNHSIVSIVEGKIAKVRCRTCYNDHDYRFEQAPPSKKDLKKAELFKEVLATVSPDGAEAEGEAGPPEADAPEVALAAASAAVEEPPPAPAAKKRGRAKRA